MFWNGEPVCPVCNNKSKDHYSLKSKGVFKGLYKCKKCRKCFTVTIATELKRSHIPLSKWVTAFQLYKKGITSVKLADELCITQKTAWLMIQRIKQSLKRTTIKHDASGKFYTKNKVAKELITILKTYEWFKKADKIEPSAGSGSFSNLVKCTAYDIDPTHENIIQQDFLKLRIKYKSNRLVFGNPPFGKQSSDAIKFIKKACKIGDYIAFILPKSFNKVSVQKRIPHSFSLLDSYEIKDNSFYIEGVNEDYLVPCVFQIWYRKGRKKVVIHNVHKDFVFTKNKGNADIAIRRVGVYTSKVITDNISNLSEQSHYFLKLNVPIESFLKRYKRINFKFINNTVGAKSLSKHEFIKEYQKVSK